MAEAENTPLAPLSCPVIGSSPTCETESLREISSQLLRRIKGAYALATLRNTEADFAQYLAACEGLDPTDATVFSDYVDDLSTRLALNTILRKVASIHRVFHYLPYPDPTAEQLNRLEIRQLLRNLPASATRRRPLRAFLLNRVLSTIGDDLIGLRDRALLMTGYDTLARREELSRLLFSDVDWHGENGGAVLSIGESKSRAGARSAWVTNRTRFALENWTSRASIRGGRLFRGVVGGSGHFRVTERLTGHAINTRLKHLLGRVGVSATGLSSHSMRMGAATDMAEHGVSLVAIQLAGGWRSPTMPARYAREFLPHRAGLGQLESLQREAGTLRGPGTIELGPLQ